MALLTRKQIVRINPALNENALWNTTNPDHVKYVRTRDSSGSLHVATINDVILPHDDMSLAHYVATDMFHIPSDDVKWNNQTLDNNNIMILPNGDNFISRLYKNNMNDNKPVLITIKENNIRIIQAFYNVKIISGKVIILQRDEYINR